MLVLALLSHTAPQKREYVLKLQGCVNYDGILQLKLLGKSAAKVIQYIRVFQKKQGITYSSYLSLLKWLESLLHGQWLLVLCGFFLSYFVHIAGYAVSSP